jgi:hypothetical protein
MVIVHSYVQQPEGISQSNPIKPLNPINPIKSNPNQIPLNPEGILNPY